DLYHFHNASLPVCFLEDHADVVQTGDETAPVHFLAAACPVGEADDVGATLPQAHAEGKELGVEDQRNEARLAVAVVTHEHRHPAAWDHRPGRAPEQQLVPFQ